MPGVRSDDWTPLVWTFVVGAVALVVSPLLPYRLRMWGRPDALRGWTRRQDAAVYYPLAVTAVLLAWTIHAERPGAMILAYSAFLVTCVVLYMVVRRWAAPVPPDEDTAAASLVEPGGEGPVG